MTTLTLIGKPDCHLCDVAGEIVDVVIADLPAEAADAVVVEQVSILDDPSLHALWWEKIPVVLINGDLHAHWRLSADRLRTALLEADREGAPA
ncbi:MULTISPECIES: glutaredoxin family protein [unclassified Microbacterium]|uniref:glutaredoxin family protein n=1 Tax=unclassified Microbacterium TaxID=2609290 RepID=UPI003744B6E6